ncbi:hypothetical protein HMPREF9944_02375 [Segatella maculosa OT 289]|uniref:Uncharacterized protein n=1 Tax=Segatella maculosa OT 289 TaxID=999422 RepID=H1HQ50_9BACT|nr:hypothetical protein HMPREF9944_02375 [Segatella maculosa OT 289]
MIFECRLNEILFSEVFPLPNFFIFLLTTYYFNISN